MKIEDALTTAIEFETKVRDHYQSALERIEDPKGREIIERLVREEQGHVSYLQASLTRWLDKGSLSLDGLLMASPSPAAMAHGLSRLEGKMAGSASPGEAQKEILEQALELEKATLGFYRSVVAELPQEAHALMERFIDIESTHLALVQAQLDSISAGGGWVDYERYNLNQEGWPEVKK